MWLSTFLKIGPMITFHSILQMQRIPTPTLLPLTWIPLNQSYHTLSAPTLAFTVVNLQMLNLFTWGAEAFDLDDRSSLYSTILSIAFAWDDGVVNLRHQSIVDFPEVDDANPVPELNTGSYCPSGDNTNHFSFYLVPPLVLLHDVPHHVHSPVLYDYIGHQSCLLGWHGLEHSQLQMRWCQSPLYCMGSQSLCTSACCACQWLSIQAGGVRSV